MSIIVSALIRRRVFSAEVHPIFMISVADCMLGLLWIVGAVIWFLPRDLYKHVWCYALALLTAILECVVVNLTIVYGILAYFRISIIGFSRLMNNSVKVRSCTVSVVYLVAWLVPMVAVMVLFGAMVGFYRFLEDVESCSCWCYPSILNVLPWANSSNGTLASLRKQSPFLLGLITILAAEYIGGFIILVILYWRILIRIREIKTTHVRWISGRRNRNGTVTTDAMTSAVQKQQSQARKRIVLFLSVFVITGFINVVIFIYLVFFLSFDFVNNSHRKVLKLVDVERDMLYAQSVTLPLQGFLNAIVYGWTRDDFIHEVVGGYKEESNISQFTRSDEYNESTSTTSSDSND